MSVQWVSNCLWNQIKMHIIDDDNIMILIWIMITMLVHSFNNGSVNLSDGCTEFIPTFRKLYFRFMFSKIEFIYLSIFSICHVNANYVIVDCY